MRAQKCFSMAEFDLPETNLSAERFEIKLQQDVIFESMVLNPVKYRTDML